MKVDIEHEQKEVKDGWFKTRTVFVCKVNVVLATGGSVCVACCA
jgi:hypothetical protein